MSRAPLPRRSHRLTQAHLLKAMPELSTSVVRALRLLGHGLEQVSLSVVMRSA